MTYYAALCVSTENTSICVVDREGAILHEGKVATEPRAINEYLQSTELPLTQVGLRLPAFRFGSITISWRRRADGLLGNPPCKRSSKDAENQNGPQ